MLNSNNKSQTHPPDNSSPGSDKPNPAAENDYSLILASGSPRRRELLEFLGLTFTVVLPDSPAPPTANGAPPPPAGPVDETPRPGESPPNLVQRLSRIKAQAVAARLPFLPGSTPQQTPIIIAADTVVVSKNKILGKPAGPAEAVQMLKQLRQQHYHFVYSGLTVGLWRREIGEGSRPAKSDGPHPPPPGWTLSPLITRLHESKVWMRPYTDAEIAAYVAGGDPLDKAGAYAIQSTTFAPVARLDGCFASVMGLPLGELAAAMKEVYSHLPGSRAGEQVQSPLPKIGPYCTRYAGRPCCQL